MTPVSRVLLFSMMFLSISATTALSQTSFWAQTNLQNDGHVQAMTINSSGHVFVGVIGDVYRPIDGVYRSTDAGASWVQINSGLNDIQIHTFAINELGHIFAGSQSEGVHRSTNNGNTWVQIHAGMVNFRIFSIVIDTTGRIFAAVDGAIYWSSDNGNNWNPCGLNDPNAFTLVMNSSGRLFAGSYGNGVVYSSTDRGDTWTQVSMGWWRPDPNYCCYQARSVFVDPGGNLFAAIDYLRTIAPHYIVEVREFYRSTNNGASWVQVVHNGMTDRDIISYLVNSEGTAYCTAFGGGVFRSTDNGLSWSDINTGLINLKVRCLSIDPSGHLYVSTDSTGVFRSIQPTTQINSNDSPPTSLELKQNYPNPFNPTTTIQYQLPSPLYVTLKMFDLLGREVAVLVDMVEPSGTRFVKFDASGIPSGVYFYRLQAGRYVETRKMIVLR